MKNFVKSRLEELRNAQQKGYCVLIDPDKFSEERTEKIIRSVETYPPFCYLVGGSLITNYQVGKIIRFLKERVEEPVVLFPGHAAHLSPEADAVLFLSLLSGRNPEYLIGQHVTAAPLIRQMGIEPLSTAYLIVDCGRPTTVSYISHSMPIPYDKPDVAACTALAGEMLGMSLVYLDGGSGAQKPVSPSMISLVRQTIGLPLMVGGGIVCVHDTIQAFQSGADLVVLGTVLEGEPDFIRYLQEGLAEM